MPAGTVDSCGAVLTLADLTQRFEVEHELRLAQRALRVLVEQSADVVVLLDPSGTLRVVNSRVAERAGLVPQQMEGHGAFEFIHPDDVARARSLLAEVVATDGGWRDVMLRLRGAGGRYHWMEGRAVNFLDEPGIAAVLVSAHDVTQRVEREEDLSRQATRDPLTGLLNRSVFATRLEHHVEHARRHGLLLTLFYWDVDGFKLSNDLAGHAVGDRVLVEIAERSTRTFRSEDTVARIGGDEFAACAEVSTEAQAAVVAERLLESLEFEVTLPDGRRLLMTASIGVAVGDPTAVAGCLSEADEAMYEAKRLGGHAISLRRIAPIDLDQPVMPQLAAREDR